MFNLKEQLYHFIPANAIINKTYSLPPKTPPSRISTSTCSSSGRTSIPNSISDINRFQAQLCSREHRLVTRSLLSRSTPALSTGHPEAVMPVLMSDADMEVHDVPVSNLTTQLLAIAAKERYMTRRCSTSPSTFIPELYASQPDNPPRPYQGPIESLSNSTSMSGLMGSAENSVSTLQQMHLVNQMATRSNSVNSTSFNQAGESRNTSMYAHQDSTDFDSQGTISTNTNVSNQGIQQANILMWWWNHMNNYMYHHLTKSV